MHNDDDENDYEWISMPKKSHHFINDRLVAALDACKLSDPDAMHVITATAIALGFDPNNLVLSRSTLKRYRSENRKKQTSIQKNRFNASLAVVHWDGKILPDIGSKTKVDRIPVIISDKNGDQLLGVPKVDRGTSANTCEVVFDLLDEWELKNDTEVLTYDTTAVNTGRYSGAHVMLERKLGRKLLALPCRHHILELRLRAAFEAVFGSTSGPNVPIFERFRKSWDNIDKTKFKFGVDDDFIRCNMNVEEIAEFCREELKKKQVRHDYKNFLELCLFFLGKASATYSFREPGPIHHARWMAKALYALKMYIFREEFRMSAKEKSAMQSFCFFIVRFYIQAWFKCASAIATPKQDHEFMKDMLVHRRIDAPIANAVIKSCCNHLYYHSDESIAFALFDDCVTFEEKKQICAAINAQTITGEVEAENKINILPAQVPAFCKLRLADFVTESTVKFFERFKMSKEFLNIDPELWPENVIYIEALDNIKHLRAVNDVAERGVKLFEQYNKLITNNEEEKQYLLQVVSAYRKKFDNYTKKALTK